MSDQVQRVQLVYKSEPIELQVSDYCYKTRSRHFSYLDKIDLNYLAESLYLKFVNSEEYQSLFSEHDKLIKRNVSYHSKFSSEGKKFKYFLKNLTPSTLYTVYIQDSFMEQNFSNLRYLKDILKNVNVDISSLINNDSKSDDIEDFFIDTLEQDDQDSDEDNRKPSFLNSRTMIKLQNTLINNHTSNERLKRKIQRREVVKNIFPLVNHMYKSFLNRQKESSQVVLNQNGFLHLSLLEENQKLFSKDVSLFKKYKKDLASSDGWAVFSFVSKGHSRKLAYNEYKFLDEFTDFDFNQDILKSSVELLTRFGRKLSDVENLVLICPDWDVSAHILYPLLEEGIQGSSISMDDMLVGWNPACTMFDFLYKKGLSLLIRFDSFPKYEIFIIE